MLLSVYHRKALFAHLYKVTAVCREKREIGFDKASKGVYNIETDAG
jgi:hypothetical protein